MPIDYDDCLNVLFLYWVEDPTACEHDELFYILGIRQLLMIYMFSCLCWEWTLNHVTDERFFVEREALEHLSD